MKIKEGGVMDIKKEREEFEKECRLLCYKGSMVMSNLGNFYNDEQTNWMWQMWLSSKAQAVPELTDKMIVSIESEVENQLKASAIYADPFRLDGEKIWYAAIEAQEQDK